MQEGLVGGDGPGESLSKQVSALKTKVASLEADLSEVKERQRRGLAMLNSIDKAAVILARAGSMRAAPPPQPPTRHRRPRPPWLRGVLALVAAAGTAATVARALWRARHPAVIATASMLLAGTAGTGAAMAYRTVPAIERLGHARHSSPTAYITTIPDDRDQPAPRAARRASARPHAMTAPGAAPAPSASPSLPVPSPAATPPVPSATPSATPSASPSPVPPLPGPPVPLHGRGRRRLGI